MFSLYTRSSARKKRKGSRYILSVHVGVFSGTEIDAKTKTFSGS